MSKLSVFNFMSLNGYFKGTEGDTSWHLHGDEENAFSHEMLAKESILLFGRKTYEMMQQFWPAPAGKAYDPITAKGMNEAEKIVCSNTLTQADWQNTRIVKGDIVAQVRALKNTAAKDITILGSGSIVSLLAMHGLIDEYQLMIDPVALPSGTPLLQGIPQRLELRLTGTRVFKSGTILLYYEPVKR